MDAAAALSSIEITVLIWSVVLLLVQVVLQATSTYDLGPKYLFSPRDEDRHSRHVVAGRLDRALKNLLETYPAFVALVAALVLTGQAGGIAATGAIVWIVARVVYVPLYALGIPVLRTLAWTISVVGLVMMLVHLL